MLKQVVIIFGAPGAGKGTQSELLSDKMGLYNFETSKILEHKFKEAESLPEGSAGRFIEVEGGKFDLVKEKKENWEAGNLVSPPLVVFWVKEKVEELYTEGKSVVFSASPRTVYEAEKLMPVLAKFYGKENIKIVLLEIKPEVTIFRNSHRKICELMRHSILFDKQTEKLTICPLDGSKLMTRKLDDPKVIKVRIKEYEERTMPMIEYLEKNKYKINKVNGEQSVAEVFADILKAIGEK